MLGRISSARTPDSPESSEAGSRQASGIKTSVVSFADNGTSPVQSQRAPGWIVRPLDKTRLAERYDILRFAYINQDFALAKLRALHDEDIELREWADNASEMMQVLRHLPAAASDAARSVLRHLLAGDPEGISQAIAQLSAEYGSHKEFNSRLKNLTQAYFSTHHLADHRSAGSADNHLQQEICVYLANGDLDHAEEKLKKHLVLISTANGGSALLWNAKVSALIAAMRKEPDGEMAKLDSTFRELLKAGLVTDAEAFLRNIEAAISHYEAHPEEIRSWIATAKILLGVLRKNGPSNRQQMLEIKQRDIMQLILLGKATAAAQELVLFPLLGKVDGVLLKWLSDASKITEEMHSHIPGGYKLASDDTLKKLQAYNPVEKDACLTDYFRKSKDIHLAYDRFLKNAVAVIKPFQDSSFQAGPV